MRHRLRVFLLWSAFGVLLLGGDQVGAQQRMGGGFAPRSSVDVQDTGHRSEVMARVQAEHERRIVQALGITPSQVTELRALLVRYRESRMQIMMERAQIRDELVRHGEIGGSEGEAERILDRTRALRAREIEMQRAEEEALLEILTPSQIIQMQVLRNRFSEQIRQLERTRSGGRP